LTTRTPPAAEVPTREQGSGNRRGADWRHFLLMLEPYFYTVPSVLLIALFVLAPLTIGLSYAFHDVTLLDPSSGTFVGFENFRQVYADESFWNALRNTVIWAATSVALQFVLGLVLAVLLNRSFPGRGIFQALVFLPWAIPSYLTGLDWEWLFNPVVGPIPHWLQAIGVMSTAGSLLSSPDHAIWGPVIANVWWGIPFFAITLLAAMQSIPSDIYEAAAIDGASAWVRFRRITLPLLAPTITITVLLRTVWVANFADLIVVMTHGGPADTTQTLPSYIFSQAFERLDFGYASAIAAALLMLLMVYAMLLISIRHFIKQRM
jgi:multiple sugar transport system permease protein